jgi:hypothetical protein
MRKRDRWRLPIKIQTWKWGIAIEWIIEPIAPGPESISDFFHLFDDD